MTRPLTIAMDEKFEKLFAMMAEMKAGQAGLENKMEDGQEEMRFEQEEMRKGQEEEEEMKNQIQVHVNSQVEDIKDHVNSFIKKVEDAEAIKGEIEDVKSEVQRKK
ncbi:hypothetical protein AVEN_106748-1 [Araneus ventricosus]|uniref:Uncharacterized protein n=1 Tax=Araneus ventricosus TaxID=182803 RepID=A0A4Y2F609_ARAVE|nr:hypothetical protein AVEN_106748-1 [Araneus ventricosus]